MNQTIPNIPVLATQINDTDLFEKADGPTSGQSQRVPAALFQQYIANGFTITQAMVDAILAWGDNPAVGSPEVVFLDNSNDTIILRNGSITIESPSVIMNAGVYFSIVPTINGGATGTFTTADLKTVTVTSGIITSIV